MSDKCEKEDNDSVVQRAVQNESMCGGNADTDDKKPEEITDEEWTSSGNCND